MPAAIQPVRRSPSTTVDGRTRGSLTSRELARTRTGLPLSSRASSAGPATGCTAPVRGNVTGALTSKVLSRRTTSSLMRARPSAHTARPSVSTQPARAPIARSSSTTGSGVNDWSSGRAIVVCTVRPGTVTSRRPIRVPNPPGDATVSRRLRVGPDATFRGCGRCWSDRAVLREPWSVRTVTLVSRPRTGPAYSGVTVRPVSSSGAARSTCTQGLRPPATQAVSGSPSKAEEGWRSGPWSNSAFGSAALEDAVIDVAPTSCAVARCEMPGTGRMSGTD